MEPSRPFAGRMAPLGWWTALREKTRTTMAETESILPPCGHTDRREQLTEIEMQATSEQTVTFLVCTVTDCPEFCRVFADLRDPAGQAADEERGRCRPIDTMRTEHVGLNRPGVPVAE